MLVWIIQISLISLILIFLVHHLYSFFMATLTIPKVRDLVNSPIEKYQHIFDTIGANNSFPKSSTNIDLLPTDNDINEYTNASYLETKNPSMKDELKNFLKKQLNTSTGNNDDLMGFSDTMSVSNFSVY
jgi:hypothetical protein